MQITSHQLLTVEQISRAAGMNPMVFRYWMKMGEIKPDFSKPHSGGKACYFHQSRIEEIRSFHAHKKSIRYDKMRNTPEEKIARIEEKRIESRAYAKNRWRTSAKRRLVHKLRCRIWKALTRNGGHPSPMTESIIGCTIPELRKHFESLFKDVMTWENYGIGGWVIDHIKPCELFDLKKIKEQKKCFHFSNLQPLTDLENRKKGSRIVI